MAISEETKREVATRLSQLETQLKGVDAEILEHGTAIASLNLRKTELGKTIAALKADIPQPTISVMEM